MSERKWELPMIGRQDILTTICEKIEQHWGKREVICLHGGGGIGKTRMLQEIVETYKLPEKREFHITNAHIGRIVLVQEDGRGEWAAEFLAGVQGMSNDFGIHLEPHNAQGDLDKMAELLKDAIASQPNALLVRGGTKLKRDDPNDVIRDLINLAVKQAIPVLTFDNYSSDIDQSVIKIMHDETGGIKKSAYELRNRLNYQGEVAIFTENTPLHQRRVAMFQNFLYDYHDIHVVEKKTFTCPSDEIGQAVEKELADVRRRFNQLKAIWTTSDAFAKPLANLLKGTNILVCSFDIDQEVVKLMTMDGSPWLMTTTTEPYKGGRVLVRLAMQKIQHEEIQDTNYVFEPRLIFQDDLRRNKDAWREDSDKKAWTPTLRTLVSKKKPQIRLSTIFDFDDRRLRNPDALEREIARQLDASIFAPFWQTQNDYVKMQKSGVGQDGLNRKKHDVEKAFCDCFNRYTENVRPVLFFDTFDDHILSENSDIWDNFAAKLPQFQNAVIIIAGREADKLGERLRPTLANELTIREIRPLDVAECKLYLQEKTKQFHFVMEDKLVEKLVFLSYGKPILLDLAVDLRWRGIALDWLATESLDILKSLKSPHKEQRQQEFERALVTHIAEARRTSDELLWLLSYIYPVDEQMIAALFDISENSAHEMFTRAQQYMFIKILPNGLIKLHDELERMVKRYVQPELDADYARFKMYTEQACAYLTDKIKALEIELLKKRSAKKFEQGDAQGEDRLQAELDIQFNIQILDDTVWVMKEQQLYYALLTHLDKGVELFVKLFAEADTIQLRRKFFKQLNAQEDLKPQYQLVKAIHQIKLWGYEKERYQDALKCCTTLFHEAKLSEEQIVDLLILEGNLKIRLGDAEGGIQDFEQAVQKSEVGFKQKTLPVLWLIKSEKELGWANRLVGYLKTAEQHYKKAKRLCLQNRAPDDKILQYDYGMILNNLAFVLSNSRRTREAAENTANTAVEHWQKIGHELGLGGGYLARGIVFYRKGELEKGFEEFQKAVDMFTSIKQEDWLAQAYAWRGATYRLLKDYSKAEDDLKEALKIGPENLKAMIFARLGRLYNNISREDKQNAKKFFYKSYRRAKKIPDHIYGLLSLSRLIMIAAEQKEYSRLDKFDKRLKQYLKKIKEPDKNNTGIAYIALARLAFGQNNEKNVDRIIDYLKKGISLVIEYGSYADRDALSRLEVIKREFESIKPVIIRNVGKALLEHVTEKEMEEDIYNSVSPMMYSWAHWKEGEV